MRVARRAALVLSFALAGTGLTACSSEDAPIQSNLQLADAGAAPVVIDASDASAASIATSNQLFASSELAYVATPETIEALADDAQANRAPLLVAGSGLAAELDRLGVTTVAAVEPDAVGDLGDRATVAVNPDGVDPAVSPASATEQAPASNVVLLTDGDVDPSVAAAVQANVDVVGGSTTSLPGGDPRVTSETVAVAKDHAEATVLALGESFGSSEVFAARFTSAATQPELPGGGQLPLENKMLIAEYGHPGAPVLGVLGERDLDEAVEHTKAQAAEYEGLTDKVIVPTFELITTVASAYRGDDGNYSVETDPEDLRPWVERAGEEGIYVVLDLQPGTSNFLDQAKLYEDLLKLPHVGLALDPEWKLLPGQRHLEQIGSVDAAEINATLDWLAELTASNALPQKVVVLHQFRTDMMPDRENVDVSHDELALVVHVDGHGSPAAKFDTWEWLLEGLQPEIQLGWKNFIDEDKPMLTPEQTVEIEPHPVFVSYQ